MRPASVSPARPPKPKLNLPALMLAQIKRYPLLWIGLAAFVLPTMASVARISWSTEQGAHGPIVLATGLWLIARQFRTALVIARPGSPIVTGLLLAALLPLYIIARLSNVVEVEGFVMFFAVIAILYSAGGTPLLKLLWFPLLYLMFVFPPPETWVAAITQPAKIAISNTAISLLYSLGYPIAGSGVTIQIGQYQLLVAAACAGLNSLISLSAIGLFYIYIRHNANWRYALLLMFAIVPVAVLANFVRVITLILLTYYAGEAAAQGFLHNFAGITMFIISVLGIFAVDSIASPLRRRLARGSEG